ncbi:YchJ family protein [Asanoa sp. WMMD1127]|uniref:YchJ family protein n=1 Tax=Asanoa sp. WMMD1127 TaxID=3016107 RepID=UPI002416ED91|nr:YchJ family protein [Asanoa sp. WMMD1127]MDG4821848.1 YchJ family protein [Asanoa sp. WMMD1127]
MLCPCGSGLSYASCCGPLHAGADRAETAERLMRSRYSAFAVGDADYLLRTWHSRTRPESLDLDPAQRWVRLEILDTVKGGAADQTGVVEFRAVFRHAGRTDELHERSRFVREDGSWVYASSLQPR